MAFAAALAAWLYAELFADDSQLNPHDERLLRAIFAVTGNETVSFLRQHDFGGTWLKQQTDPIYDLAHLTGQATSEFEDKELDGQLREIKQSAEALASRLALGSWSIGTSASIFSMIPDQDRDTGQWSEQTKKRVSEVNELADALANELEGIYRLARQRKVALA